MQKKDNSTTHYHTLQKFKYLTALFVKHCIKYAVICAKSAEPIEVPYVWVVGSDGPKESCVRWGPNAPMGKDNFGR